MPRTIGSPRLFVRLDHVASFIANANHSIMRAAIELSQPIVLAIASGWPTTGDRTATRRILDGPRAGYVRLRCVELISSGSARPIVSVSPLIAR